MSRVHKIMVAHALLMVVWLALGLAVLAHQRHRPPCDCTTDTECMIQCGGDGGIGQ